MDDIRYLWSLLLIPITYLIRLIWTTHTSLHDLREEIAKDYYTSDEVKEEITSCSEAKDKAIMKQKEDLAYIRTKLDMLIERAMK